MKAPIGEGKRLDQFVCDIEGGTIIQLDENKMCPFLDEKKLCKLVIEHGEESLSNTCKTFPRQVQEFIDRKEYSMVACCPTVIDTWRLQKVKENSLLFLDKQGDYAYQIRNQIFAILSDSNDSNELALLKVFFFVLDVFENKKSIHEKLKIYSEGFVLKELEMTIRKMKFSRVDTLLENNEFFLDLIENYRKEKRYCDYLEEIAHKAEELFTTIEESQLEKKIDCFYKEWKEYQDLFSNYLIEECFANLIHPDCQLDSVIIMTQWIAIEYVMIRHSIFLQWIVEGEDKLVYEMVRDKMVVLSRMTGYDVEDIEEYLANSFEDITWEWGYFALLVGI